MTGGRSFAAALLVCLGFTGPASAGTDPVKRGEYLTAAGGCVSCHTDFKAKGKRFAGGAAIRTPFGEFYGPNITPHRQYGIGAWTDAEFIAALRDGIAPDGTHYFPSFPYPSFTGITDRDMLAIKAYLFSLAPVATASRPHAVRFPFGWRFPVTFWKWLYFKSGSRRADPARTASGRRGAYLVLSLAHCGECHTPRDALGGPRVENFLGGAALGPKGDEAPNITPHPKFGIGRWSDDEIATYLKLGMDPDGDFATAPMADVIEHTTSRLTDSDIAAIIVYLRSVAPVGRGPGAGG